MGSQWYFCHMAGFILFNLTINSLTEFNRNSRGNPDNLILNIRETLNVLKEQTWKELEE